MVKLQGSFLNLDDALATDRYDGIVICSPPKFHVPQAVSALRRRLPVFMEKPLGVDAASAEDLLGVVHDTGVPVLLGYTYRWWKPLQDFRSRLSSGTIGTPYHVKCVMSAHLADWHPWEPYQGFFMSSRDLGGGALLDESHFVDVLLWFFGMPDEVFARVEKLSELEIETDDNVDAWFAYANGMRVSLHLDLFGRPHEKFITVTGSAGTIEWSIDPNRIRLSRSSTQEAWEEVRYSCERNDMFVSAAQEFLDVLEGNTSPSCTAEEGYRVLRILDAMRASSVRDAVVKL